MQALIILALFSALITGCSGKKDKNVDERTGLTDEEYAKMMNINQTLTDLDLAVSLSRPPALMNEKVEKMSDSMKAANCRHEGSANPIEKYDVNWTPPSHIVGGAGCPIELKTDWSTTANSIDRVWTFKKEIKVTNEAFGKEANLKSLGIVGTIEVKRSASGADQDVRIEVVYNNLTTHAEGQVLASIKSPRMRFNGRRGSGTVTFNLQTRNNLKVKLEIFLTPSRPARYRINGTNVDEFVVTELFSAFKPDEIKARFEKMLY